MAGISHVDAVDVLKSITDSCHLVVSREVLIVLPEDISSPPPGDKANTVTTPAPEDQSNKNTTPPPSQIETVVSSLPPDGQVTKTSPPPEDEVDKSSPPPSEDQRNTDTNTLTVSSIMTSRSTEEMRTFGEQISQAALAAQEGEVITEQIVERLLEGAPQLEDQPGDDVKGQQHIEVKGEDQSVDRADDTSVLEEFAEQLRRLKEEENEEISMHVNTSSTEPRDNYVNYDIAQAVIVTSPSNDSLANSVHSGDPPAHESNEQLDKIDEAVKNKPPTVELTATKPSVKEPTAKVEVEVKKSEPKVVAPVSEEVVLSRGSGPLGMNIVGGSDRSSFPFGKGFPGVFISKVHLINDDVKFVFISQSNTAV